jgi:hypothetical protein
VEGAAVTTLMDKYHENNTDNEPKAQSVYLRRPPRVYQTTYKAQVKRSEYSKSFLDKWVVKNLFFVARNVLFLCGLALIGWLWYRNAVGGANHTRLQSLGRAECNLNRRGIHSITYHAGFMNEQLNNCTTDNLLGDAVCVQSSKKISGNGLFAQKPLQCLTAIAVGIKDVRKYGFGGFSITTVAKQINHCKHANLFLIEWSKHMSLPNRTEYLVRSSRRGRQKQRATHGSAYLLITSRDIKYGEELYLDYDALPWYIYPAMPWYKPCE